MAFGFGEDKKKFGGFGNNPAPEKEVVADAVVEAEQVVQSATASDAEASEGIDALIGEYTSKIGAAESKIKDIYYELGEAYYDLHKDNAEYDLVSFVNAIKDKNALIADFRSKINEIKGIVVCDKCGAETKKTSTFCIECGNKLKKAEAAPTGQIACVNCNGFIEADAKFCPICGFRVSVAAATSTVEADKKMDAYVDTAFKSVKDVNVTPVAEPVAEPASSVPVKEEEAEHEIPYSAKLNLEYGGAPKKCPECGQDLESFDMVCFACGCKL